MEVKVELKETSWPIVHKEVCNTYTKGNLYCVFSKKENRVWKYPLANIWRISESYRSGK